MNKWIISLLLLLALAACGPSANAPTPTTEQPARATPTTDSSLQPGSNNTSGQGNQTSYPSLPPTPTPYPDDYPAPPPPPTPVNPYPGTDAGGTETVWILHPLGQQCADTSTYKYPNQQEARADLTAAGINVLQMETEELMVCQACDCPTSTHYRAEISSADLNKALALGWTAE
ncbi:MAG: hypothetical protein H6659_00120 [Ardenticatenaceae bacterium]|nr:hypothetical protein [Ardenticatenaceae bacterium]MCB8986999.1 hypothetical protein [Ardenticatenaceae bacterium]